MARNLIIATFLFVIFKSYDCNLLKSFSVDSPTLFQADERISKYAPPLNLNAELSNKTLALPTNRWWGNLIHKSNWESNNPEPIWLHPYSLQVETQQHPYGLNIQYPFAARVKSDRQTSEGAIKFYYHDIEADIKLSGQFKSSPRFAVTKWDDLGVFIEFKQGKEKMKSYLASGMAFITSTYSNLKPLIASRHNLVSVNKETEINGMKVTGSKFVLEYGNGMTWVVYSSSPISFKINQAQQLISDNNFKGDIRIALLDKENLNDKVYDSFSSCVLKGGKLQVPNLLSYEFKWKTYGDCSKGFLHFAFPHHFSILDQRFVKPFELFLYSSTRGKLQAFVAKETSKKDSFLWKLNENDAANFGFYSSKAPTAETIKKYNIVSILEKEINSQSAFPRNKEYYFSGKVAQKRAFLCLLASDPVLVGDDKKLRKKCVSKLQVDVLDIINNKLTYPLVYDTIWKGISSSRGFAVNDINAEFGNAVYNDHHIQYGYWVATLAVLRFLDPTWTHIKQLDSFALSLLRDYVNPSDEDKHFTTFRHFDWFRGHSYSHGITPYRDGKDIQSPSQDVNSLYAMFLYGEASKNTNMVQLAKLMLNMNKRSIQTYFLLEEENTIHPIEIQKNKVPGIYFDNKLDYATYWTADVEAIHGIQMLPVSEATDLIRSIKFIREEWNSHISKFKAVTSNNYSNAWLSILFSNVAAIDHVKALEMLSRTDLAFDDGLSQAYALFHAACMDPLAKKR